MAGIDYPEEAKALIGELKKLPGVGPRSAERMAIWLLQSPKANPEDLARVVQRAGEEVGSCERCGFFASGSESECPVCSATGRDDRLLCVVEQATDVLPIERSGAYRGYYHCLGGKLSPLDGVGPEDLRIDGLLKRVRERSEMEVVLAVGSDVEGEATANYLMDVLGGEGCSVTRLAQGLPAGSALEYADELTLHRAFEGRK